MDCQFIKWKNDVTRRMARMGVAMLDGHKSPSDIDGSYDGCRCRGVSWKWKFRTGTDGDSSVQIQMLGRDHVMMNDIT